MISTCTDGMTDLEIEADNVVIDFDDEGKTTRIRRLGQGELIALSPNRRVSAMEIRGTRREFHPDGSCTIIEWDHLANTTRITEVKSPQLSLFG